MLKPEVTESEESPNKESSKKYPQQFAKLRDLDNTEYEAKMIQIHTPGNLLY